MFYYKHVPMYILHKGFSLQKNNHSRTPMYIIWINIDMVS